MEKIFFGTTNKNKIKEIKQILGSDIEIITPSDINLDIDIEETGKSFIENAEIKAVEMYKIVGIPVIAEDSGLCIKALNGRPGIYSKRYYENVGKSEKDGNLMILDEMRNIPIEKRAARYIAVYCYYDGKVKIFGKGKCEGLIITKLKGTNGFAYDSIFYSFDLNKTFAEAEDDEKQMVSHRRRGIENLKENLNVF